MLSRKTIHPAFTLQEKSFKNKDELLFFSTKISLEVHYFLEQWFNEKEYVFAQTSGSTGKPKSIKIEKQKMMNSALATGTFFNLKQKTTALLCMNAKYIAGKMMLVRALVLGWQLYVVKPTSNPLKGLHKNFDFCAMVPMQLQNSLSELGRIKKLIVGGGVVSNQLLEQIQAKKTKIFATYGMTETITHIAVKKLNSTTKKVEKNSFYKALPKVIFEVDNRSCLVINARKISEEKIVTNDVVSLISEKEFEWLGRYDNVINSGGIKLYPEKIEKKLSKIIKQRFFVAGIKDTVLGEKLILVVEGKKQVINLNSLPTISKYEIPKEIYFIDNFTETETKKIQRERTLTGLKL